MTTHQLQEVRIALRQNLRSLHQIDISHGDFQPMIVIVRPDSWRRSIAQDTDLAILDLERAYFRRKARNWKRDMVSYLEMLDRTFAIANEKLVSTKLLSDLSC